MSMLRELERRDALADVVHVHSERCAESVIFADLLDGMAERHLGYVRHTHFTESKDRLGPAAIAELCDDCRDRRRSPSGPARCSTPSSITGRRREIPSCSTWSASSPPTEPEATQRGRAARFALRHRRRGDLRDGRPDPGRRRAGRGRSRLRLPDGICHTCVGRLAEGRVRDLRTGEVQRRAGRHDPDLHQRSRGPRRSRSVSNWKGNRRDEHRDDRVPAAAAQRRAARAARARSSTRSTTRSTTTSAQTTRSTSEA